MRRALDGLYLASGVLAGFFLMCIAVTVIAQIVGRYFAFTVDATELSGYCLAASSFLGLAYTLRHGAHIRVNLMIGLAKGRIRQGIEILVVAGSAVLVGFFAWQAALMAIESYDFGDISPGLIRAPLWIPQLGMVFGLSILTIALIDELFGLVRGLPPTYEVNAPDPLSGDGQ